MIIIHWIITVSQSKQNLTEIHEVAPSYICDKFGPQQLIVSSVIAINLQGKHLWEGRYHFEKSNTYSKSHMKIFRE